MQYVQSSMKAIQFPEPTALSYFFRWLKKEITSKWWKKGIEKPELIYLKCPTIHKTFQLFWKQHWEL